MTINLDLLKKVCEIPGAPGHENKVRKLLINEISSYVDNLEIDNMGNLIVSKKGKSNKKKVMVAAHMDEIGFMVKHIDEKGFLYFTTLGGFDPKTLTSQRVIVHGKEDIIGVMGSKPIHVMNSQEKEKTLQIDDYFIDVGLSYQEVKTKVSVGDTITRMSSFIEMGKCVNCKSLDNRVSVFVLLETLKLLENLPYDVYAVFSVQEEVGIRGANVAAHSINPTFGIALDTTIAYDLPNSKQQEMVTSLGKGVAIKIMDASAICDYRMVNYLKKIANENRITWQAEILTAGGTDTSGIQRMGKNGAIAGAISIPTRYLHQAIEMSHTQDIKNTVSLLKLSLENLDRFDWEHN